MVRDKQANLIASAKMLNIGVINKSTVTFVSKGRVPMRSTGSVEQPIELLSGLTY